MGGKFNWNSAGGKLLVLVLQIFWYGSLVTGAAYWLFLRPAATKTDTTAPGWDNLLLCSDLTSIDETKELTLSSDHTANLAIVPTPDGTHKLSAVNSPGTWTFDETSKLYSLTISGATESYTLISPGSNCILAKGNLNSADLSGSWFSTFDPTSTDYQSEDSSP